MSCQAKPTIQTTKRPLFMTGNQLIPVGSSNLYKIKNENKKFITIKTTNGSIIKSTINCCAETSKSNDLKNEDISNRLLITRDKINNNNNNNSNKNINTIKSTKETKQINGKQQNSSSKQFFLSPLSPTLQHKTFHKQRMFITGQSEQLSIIKKNGVINDVKLNNNVISNHSTVKVPTTTLTLNSSCATDHNNQKILNILNKSNCHTTLIPSTTKSQSIYSDHLNNSLLSSIDDVKTDTFIDKFDPSNWINNVTNTFDDLIDHKYTNTKSTSVKSQQSPPASSSTASQSPSSATIKKRKIKSIVKIHNDKTNSNNATNSKQWIPTTSNTINIGKLELVNRKTIPTLNKIKQRINTKEFTPQQNPPKITNNIKKVADNQKLLNRSNTTKRSYSQLSYHEIIQRIENNRRITTNANKTNIEHNRNGKHSNVIPSTSTVSASSSASSLLSTSSSSLSSTQTITSAEYKPEANDDLSIDNNDDDSEIKHRYLAFKLQQFKNIVNKRQELEFFERRRYPIVSVYHKSIMEETRKLELSKYKCLLCSKNVVPLSTYCKLHIVCDSNQYLYKQCTGLYPDNSVCNAPILDILSKNPAFCSKHNQTSVQTIDKQKIHTDHPKLQCETLNDDDLHLSVKSPDISCNLPQEIQPTNYLLHYNELLSNTDQEQIIVVEQTQTPTISEINHNKDVFHLSKSIPDVISNNDNNNNNNDNPKHNENNSSNQIVSNKQYNNIIEQIINNNNNNSDNENIIKAKCLMEQTSVENNLNGDVNSLEINEYTNEYPLESVSIYENSESSDDTGIGGSEIIENTDENSLNPDKLLEEHDLTNVLNQIPVDAFNEFFTAQSNEKYEPPTLQEHEDLERALRAVDEQVRSLEQMTDDDTTNFLDVDFLEDGILDETEICTDVFETQEIVEIH